MKKHLVNLIAAIVAIFCGLFAFSACSRVEFKVNFVVDGAVYATLNTNGEEIIKMPENPTKDDYDFDGWYWDKDVWQKPFTANSLLDAPLSSDMNVYCKWKPKAVHVSGISLNKSEVSLHVNETEILTATITPENATDTSVLWESSNATIATVTGGKITALRVGSATITATANDGGQITSCEVYVTPISVESVSLNYTQLSMLYGESKTLTASVTPQNATETGVIWKSSNASVVAVENGKLTATGYGSAVITATTADGGKTATCAVKVIDDTITFKTLQVAADGETVYGKVSNATTMFSFLKEIEEHGNATYQVYKEITCETLLASKSISLNVGDNTVYILQTVGKDLKLYTVTVRRRPIYNVSFDSNGGTAVQSQQVEEDSFVTAPAEPSRIGYTFTRWNYDFSQAITKRTEIKAVWLANTDTKYRVEYYWENVENDEYTLHETSDMQGTTDTAATAEIKDFAHFTHKATATDSGNIAPDGSLVLKVYYTRDKYNVTFESNGGTLKSGEINQVLKYEGAAVAPVFTRTGYTLIGWDKNFSSVNSNITIAAQWKINQYSLTLVLGGVLENEIITQDYNSTLEIPNPERAGYDFIAWDQEIPETMPAENITRTAKWNVIFKLSENGDTITGLTDYGKNKYTEIVIPAEIDGVKITSIGDYAFSRCSGLTSITIPDSVTYIGDGAFYECSGLTNITIPNSVTSIGNYAFHRCSGLTSVTVPNSVTSIGDYAFYGCSGLTSIAMPNSVTSIGFQAFYRCSGLTSVTIPDSVTSIGDWAFCECSNLKSITIPNSVTSIGDDAFYGCRNLKIITIPDSVTSIGYSAFYGCSGLYRVCITDLEKWCKISFGNNYSNPLYYANSLYLNNKLVTDLIIPDSITSIGDYVFSGCSLKSITIPNSVTSIGDGAFYICSGLTSVTIPDSVTSIGDDAFYYCRGLTSIAIPNSVSSIGDSAFEHCSRLTIITIPDSVTSIGNSAFAYSGLTSITIPDSVTSIGNSAFAYSGLTSITIPDSITTISKETFMGCKLKSVTIPDSVTSIGEKAFDNCRELTAVTIPNSITSIGNYAFQGCSGLLSVIWNAVNCKNCGSSDYPIFSNCTKLTNVTIGENVKCIPSYAFSNCRNLKDITIADSVTSIGFKAFYNCSGLTSIAIPNSVTSIGHYAFSGCTWLDKVYYKGKAEEWNQIDISGYSNDKLTNATRYYYSETKPEAEGNFWHYNESGEIEEW